ncbi:MAG: TIGR03621 family F420-dependent LLM class oxidoreductase [Thermomicrobiales bacterium]
MAEPRPLTFSAMVSGGESGTEFIGQVKRIEEIGFTSVSMVDHFNRTFAPVPALTAAAMAAPSLRVLATVFNNDLRNPVLFAKEMATIDQISDGRLDIGLGAGWLERDYLESGTSYDRPGTRIERLEEAIRIMKRAWSGEEFSFKGEHYTVKNHRGYPLPVQQLHPPIYIGGGGRRLLSVAGRQADIIGVHVRNGRDWSDDREDNLRVEIEKKIGWIRDAAGGRFAGIRLALLVFAARIVTSESERDAEYRRIAEANNMTIEAAVDSPYYLVGTAGELAHQFLELQESFGFSHFTIGGRDVEGFGPVLDELR